MALDPARLATSLKARIISKLSLGTFDDTQLQAFCEAFAETVIEEIDDYAELDMAVLDSGALTGTANLTTGDVVGTVTTLTVSGGIK